MREDILSIAGIRLQWWGRGRWDVNWDVVSLWVPQGGGGNEGSRGAGSGENVIPGVGALQLWGKGSRAF